MPTCETCGQPIGGSDLYWTNCILCRPARDQDGHVIMCGLGTTTHPAHPINQHGDCITIEL